MDGLAIVLTSTGLRQTHIYQTIPSQPNLPQVPYDSWNALPIRRFQCFQLQKNITETIEASMGSDGSGL